MVKRIPENDLKLCLRVIKEEFVDYCKIFNQETYLEDMNKCLLKNDLQHNWRVEKIHL